MINLSQFQSHDQTRRSSDDAVHEVHFEFKAYLTCRMWVPWCCSNMSTANDAGDLTLLPVNKREERVKKKIEPIHSLFNKYEVIPRGIKCLVDHWEKLPLSSPPDRLSLSADEFDRVVFPQSLSLRLQHWCIYSGEWEDYYYG